MPVPWIEAMRERSACRRHCDTRIGSQRDGAFRETIGAIKADEIPPLRDGPGHVRQIRKDLGEGRRHGVELGSQQRPMPLYQPFQCLPVPQKSYVPELIELVRPNGPDRRTTLPPVDVTARRCNE